MRVISFFSGRCVRFIPRFVGSQVYVLLGGVPHLGLRFSCDRLNSLVAYFDSESSQPVAVALLKTRN